MQLPQQQGRQSPYHQGIEFADFSFFVVQGELPLKSAFKFLSLYLHLYPENSHNKTYAIPTRKADIECAYYISYRVVKPLTHAEASWI